MSGKITKKMGQKITDVTKPKKTEAAQPLVVQSRPIMARNIAVSTPVDDDPRSEPAAAAPTLTAPRRTVIQPLEASAAEAPSEPAAPTQKQEATPEATASTPQPSAPQPSAPEQAEAEPSDRSGVKPTPETKKAVEEAARAAKREQELEALIDSKQFNVPINAVARKKSIKISAWLTFLLFLLGIALIDLMLDSGAIWLVQKIPHTNFFQTLINL